MKNQFKKFYLYRVKFIRNHQKDIFDDGASSSEIFIQAIKSKPSVNIDNSGEWRLGNVSIMGSDRGWFAIGRISPEKREKYDFEEKNFFDSQDYKSPYAIVLFNYKLGIVAIEGKRSINSRVVTTANRVKDILVGSDAVKNRKVICFVEEINDPRSLVNRVVDCQKVLRFGCNFTGPNPIDADEFFGKPLEVYADRMHASQGKIEVSGDGLDKESVIAATKTSAATANGAFVNILDKNGKKHRIPLRKNAASFVSRESEFEVLYKNMMDSYKEVRYERNRDK